MKLHNSINNKHFENLFLANWTNILNYKQILAALLEHVQLNKDSLKAINENDLPKKSVQITISYAKLHNEFMTLWFDFTIPYDNEIAVGTVETQLFLNGELRVVNLIGHRFIQHPKS